MDFTYGYEDTIRRGPGTVWFLGLLGLVPPLKARRLDPQTAGVKEEVLYAVLLEKFIQGIMSS